MKISVIIPIAGSNRREHLEACLHFLHKQDYADFEIVLVEQVDCLLGGRHLSGGPFYNDCKVGKYLAIRDPNENHFNQPWMANVGAQIADGDRFLFYDVDLVCGTKYLTRLSHVKAPYFIAWGVLYNLDAETSKWIMTTRRLPDQIEGFERFSPGALLYAGFSVSIDKNFFFRQLGGYNENYLGWGGNDNDIAYRALKILKTEYKFDASLFHLWHPKGYSRNLVHERRTVWYTTRKHPHIVTRRLRSKQLGNPKHQTYINLEDIKVEK